MPLKIETFSGRNEPWSGQFEKDEVTIGRAAHADVCLDTAERLCASGIHARFVCRQNHWFLVVDHANGVTWRPDRGLPKFLRSGEEAEVENQGELTIGRKGPRLRISTGASAPMHADDSAVTIRILTGFNSPWTGTFDQREITIGRSPKADVRLHPQRDIACASGIHARVVRWAEHWFVESVHSGGVIVHDSHGGKTVLPAMGRAVIRQETDISLGKNGPTLRVTPPESQDDTLPVTCMDSPARMPAYAGGIAIEEIVQRGEAQIKRGVNRVAVASSAGILLLLTGAWIGWQKEGSERLRDHLAEAQRSVYLVGCMKDGNFVGMGTAWVADKGTLATNAHVAEGLRELRRKDLKLMARLPGTTPKDFEIIDIKIHPGWARVQPLSWAVCLAKDNPGAHLLSFDVATLSVLGDVGPPLPIASKRDLLTLRSGDAVGYVGFPMENINGVQGNQPPTIAIGNLTAIQDALGQVSVPEFGIVLQHSIPATGGSSGSPIINSDGKVIGLNNAMNGITVPGLSPNEKSNRISVGLNCAQRVDLLADLLQGRAEQGLADYEEYLIKGIKLLGVKPVHVARAALKFQLARWSEAGVISAQSTARVLLDVEEALRPNGNTRTVSVQQGRHYLFIACAEGFSPLRLELLEGAIVEMFAEGRFVVMPYISAATGQFRLRTAAVSHPNDDGQVAITVVELQKGS